jgi:hypothetical protein
MHLGRFGFGLPQRASGVAEAEEAQRRAASRWDSVALWPEMIIYRLLSLAAARSKHSNRAALSEIRVHCSKTGGAAAGAALKAAAPPVDDLGFSIATPGAVASCAPAALAARSRRFKSATSD